MLDVGLLNQADLKARVLQDLSSTRSLANKHPSGYLSGFRTHGYHNRSSPCASRDWILPETLDESTRLLEAYDVGADFPPPSHSSHCQIRTHSNAIPKATEDASLEEANEVMDRYGLWKPEIFVTKEHKVILMEPRGLCEGCFELRSECLCDVMATFEVDHSPRQPARESQLPDTNYRLLSPNHLGQNSVLNTNHIGQNPLMSHSSTSSNNSGRRNHSPRISTLRSETIPTKLPSSGVIRSLPPLAPMDTLSSARCSHISVGDGNDDQSGGSRERLAQFSPEPSPKRSPGYASPTLSALLKSKNPALLAPK